MLRQAQPESLRMSAEHSRCWVNIRCFCFSFNFVSGIVYGLTLWSNPWGTMRAQTRKAQTAQSPNKAQVQENTNIYRLFVWTLCLRALCLTLHLIQHAQRVTRAKNHSKGCADA